MDEKKQPRKVPTQDRSRATVRFILDATRRVIAQHGVDGMRVNAVAELAGVGVASIYQYFPTREALLAAWEENSFDNLLQAALARSATMHEERTPPERSIFELALRGLEMLSVLAATSNVPIDMSRKEERSRMIDMASQVFAQRLSEMQDVEPRLRDKDLPMLTRLAIHTILLMGHERVVRAGPLTEDEERAIAWMVTQMFLGPPPPPVTDG